jgi:hypothetical protein
MVRYVESSPLSDPEAAMHKLLDIANGAEPDAAGVGYVGRNQRSTGGAALQRTRTPTRLRSQISVCLILAILPDRYLACRG